MDTSTPLDKPLPPLSNTDTAKDQEDTAESKDLEKSVFGNSSLSSVIELDGLWDNLSVCLERLSQASDPHAVLVLQSAAQAFFLIHASPNNGSNKEQQKDDGQHAGRLLESVSVNAGGGPSSPLNLEQIMNASVSGGAGNDSTLATGGHHNLPKDTSKLVTFAEKHRHILNHILSQSKVHLSDGPFSVLIDHPRLLDFDVKRKYFKKELSRLDDNRARRYRDDMPLRIRRSHVFQDSFRELFRLQKQDWKNRFYIMFDGEEGQDAGGVLREWYSVVTKDIFNPNYALFKIASGDGVTHMINPASYINIEHLDYFKVRSNSCPCN